MVLHALHLCSGYGGFELGLRLAGVPTRTVCHVERDSHAAATLVARMEDSHLDLAPVWSDLTTFDTEPWVGRVDIITAGFPCQPFSSAGQQRGVDDPRWLWPAIERIVGDLGPRYVFLENVPQLVTKGLPHVLQGLASLGFDAEWGLHSAAEAGAPHKRERVWILAYTPSVDGVHGGRLVVDEPERWRQRSGEHSEDLADASSHGRGSTRDTRPGAEEHDAQSCRTELDDPEGARREVGDCRSERERNTPDLPAQASLHHGLLAEMTSTDGGDTSMPVDLNPRFVEALMGVPKGWLTPSTSVETAWYQQWRRAHSLNSHAVPESICGENAMTDLEQRDIASRDVTDHAGMPGAHSRQAVRSESAEVVAGLGVSAKSPHTTSPRDSAAAPTKPAAHPAKFSAEIIAELIAKTKQHLALGATILDPFAGVGGVHVLREHGFATWGVELEREWAEQSPWTLWGDSTVLPGMWGRIRLPMMFDAIATSPAYGNRMADQYLGNENEKCRACGGHGKIAVCGPESEPTAASTEQCRRCNGTGKSRSNRNTYAFKLNRRLTPGSTAALQWTGREGDEYRALHEKVYAQCDAVLRPGGFVFLNVSDHIRAEVIEPVSAWHREVWLAKGYAHVSATPIVTRRNRQGANGDARVPNEWLFVLRKPEIAS